VQYYSNRKDRKDRKQIWHSSKPDKARQDNKRAVVQELVQNRTPKA
jgi:hypothetical protein